MGIVVPLKPRQSSAPRLRSIPAREQLPLLLSRLLAAGATDFARIALDAWGKQELEPEELLELCTTYASVAGLENFA